MIERLPAATVTVHAELLEQMVSLAPLAPAIGTRGSFVSKVISGQRYWYLQKLEGGRKRQIYLGPESDELLRTMDQLQSAREDYQTSAARFRELSRMAVAGGIPSLQPAVSAVLELLAELHMFRFGGVLIGSHAFGAYSAMLGVRLDAAALRTEDIDVAHDRKARAASAGDAAVSVAVDRTRGDMLEELKGVDPRFFAVPSLDSRKASTSFAIRGMDLRVDFLTAARAGEDRPVQLPLFNVSAQPLPNLDFLTDEQIDAVLHGRSPILVKVPDPARFALHKIWASAKRPAAFQAKAGKDLQQAGALVEVLLSDRPHDLRSAWKEARARRMITIIRQGAALLGDAGRDLMRLLG